MSDRVFRATADLADRRTALLRSADAKLQHLLGELNSTATGVMAALEHPSTYSSHVELALHQLRRQIVVAGQTEWVRQLDELHSASRAIWAASEIARQLVGDEGGGRDPGVSKSDYEGGGGN